MREIAQGLEPCNINFIWIIKFPVGDKTSIEETLPQDYLDRVRRRGLVVEGWASHARIFAHCGFSVMEKDGERRKKLRTMGDKIKIRADEEIDRVMAKLCEKRRQQQQHTK
ncbi:hypothetical protein MTR67_003548 [Solanum verrucosum]|uniref:Uncharacterized protein n=1 Tax=Solanum verrucosum TaxID=315347 RepID=A0AAF0TAH1_SOLVR|nr:hypothetical protein MTR67_003548 [Solanum verrucosum]